MVVDEAELAESYARVDGGWIEGAVEREEVYQRIETALGFRLTRELTLRGSYMTRSGYVVVTVDEVRCQISDC